MRCDRIIGTSRMSSVRQLTDPVQGSDSPPIGVVIPTYNRSTVLLSCLRRLEHQTYPDFEVVIVDDGSTQPVEKMLEEYARESRLRISYLRQENSGPARARNAAIAALQTPICLMIGDDILVSPGFVSSHLELHRKRPEANVAGLGLTRWSESEQQVTKFMRWLDETGIQFAAIERVVAGLTSSGAVSAVGNRRAFRVGEEPLDAFRRYCAVYAREQAFCHFSPALIANLERYWGAQNRVG